MSGLRLEGIRSRALGPLDLTLAAGELVFVSGPSGSGKSLLLRAVADLDPHEGEVWLGEEPRSRIAPATWRRRVGLLPAEAFWWAESVGEHLPSILSTHADRAAPEPVSRPSSLLRPALPRLPKPLRRPPGRVSNHPALPDPSTMTDWLDRLGFAPDVLGWSVTRLSTGERQRLALVRLLAQTPEALLLDEATANLDPSNSARVESVVETYRKAQGAAVLWVSHDPEQRRRIGGRSLIIRNERLEPEA
ncbi:ABC transporter ATP-binding protein [Thiocapsa marina]|uniref:ABC transporter related protein n=1 Tax=Thiocapsa marina 5811 TaxID=768671 RepID=F9UCH7_9GAMM|nr:ATP-binding cassette domain-containing protein [Thiocapsa marina]EGV18090.1 ABC transporter related protein [Thiocapsa marina 5811]